MIRPTRSENGILTITIDNTTSANALRPGMLDALIYAFEAASENHELRGILLTGAGDKGFSAGMDTAQFNHSNPSRAFDTITQLGQVCEAIKNMDRCGFLNTVVEDSAVAARALEYLHETMKADRAVIAQQKRLHRTWKNSFEREALADSRKEFALAFARKND